MELLKVKKIGVLGIIGVLIILGIWLSSNREKKVQDRYRVYYEIFVGAFADSNGDGIGDLQGIIEHLDYLEELGIEALWLTPIMPSPDYHKYSVTDYKAIDPSFGTMADFERLVKEAKKRDMIIIMDLVLNHSSSEHPWFKAAKEGKNDYYHFVKGEKPEDSQYFSLGKQDWYYEGVFSERMPDLNMDSWKLREEVEDIAAFWLSKGIGGFRLDAAKYIYNDEQKTLAFWKWFYEYCKGIDPNIYMVGEVWSSGSEIEAYYATGIDSFFNFPYAQSNGRIVKAVRQKRGGDFAKGIAKWQERIQIALPQAVDAPFLSNHDQDRITNVLGKKENQQKMAASLYLMMPGNPFIYYGEEIGMLGEGNDPNRRQNMKWEEVDSQLKDPDSLLVFYKQAIKIRRQNPELARGKVVPLEIEEAQVAAYTVTYKEKEVVVVHNLSEEAKILTLPMKQSKGYKLMGQLTTTGEKIKLKKGQLVLPPQSTAVLK